MSAFSTPPQRSQEGDTSRDVEDAPASPPPRFNEQTNYVPRGQIIKIFLTLSASTICALLDQTTLAVALPTISAELGAGTQSAWISSAYFLTSTSFQLLYGRISDIIGRKVCLLSCIALFFLGSLSSSLAQTTLQLIIFRAITGIGGGGLITLGQVVISDVVSLRERGKYQGILGAVVALSNGVGPVLGGTLASKASWRDIFRIMLPISALSFTCVTFFLPLKKVHGSAREKAMAIDWIGAALTLSSSILVVLALTWGGGEHAWSSTWVLVPLLLGCAIAVLFCLWEWKGAAMPLMPLSLFHKRLIIGGMSSQFISGWCFLVQIFYVTQYFQLIGGKSAILSGVLLIPLTMMQTISSTASGFILSWTGTYRWTLLFGWAIWSVAMGLFSTLDVQSGVAKGIGFGMLAGLGVGCTLQISLVAMQGAVRRSDQAVTTATRSFFRNLGGSLGLAVASTIINNTVSRELKPLGWTTPRIKAALNDPSQLLSSSSQSTLTSTSLELLQLRQAYRKGFQANFWLLSALTGVAWLLTLLLMPQRSVDRKDDQALRDLAIREMREKKEGKRKAKEGSATSVEESGAVESLEEGGESRDAETSQEQKAELVERHDALAEAASLETTHDVSDEHKAPHVVAGASR